MLRSETEKFKVAWMFSHDAVINKLAYGDRILSNIQFRYNILTAPSSFKKKKNTIFQHLYPIKSDKTVKNVINNCILMNSMLCIILVYYFYIAAWGYNKATRLQDPGI